MWNDDFDYGLDPYPTYGNYLPAGMEKRTFNAHQPMNNEVLRHNIHQTETRHPLHQTPPHSKKEEFAEPKKTGHSFLPHFVIPKKIMLILLVVIMALFVRFADTKSIAVAALAMHTIML